MIKTQTVLASLSLIEDGSKPEPVSWELAFTRLMAGIIMHTRMAEEFNSGLNKMKFALNHPWKFDSCWQAWVAGFLQTMILILVSVCNYLVIISMQNVSDVLINFLALLVISELDNFFYAAHGVQEFGKRIVLKSQAEYKELFTIETTTSSFAFGSDNPKIDRDN